jgi:hypothetical protein
MGSQAQVTGTGVGPARRGRFAAIFSLALVTALVAAQPAAATFHEISIREVYPGSTAAPQSSYVEVQMWAAGQDMVGGHGVSLYDASGTQVAGSPFNFGSNLSAGSTNQETILIGDDGVQAAFGVIPDLVNSSFNVPAAGGAACWAGTIDCVAWGSFSGSPPSPVGAPADSPSGIPNGKALRRSITGGSCTNLLDSTDDTNVSSADFADATPPSPVRYGAHPSSPACTPPTTPTATIDSGPPAKTKATSADFTFHSNTVGAEFECKLDTGVYAACNSGSISYPGPLAEGSHSFQVRAKSGTATGVPDTHSWEVDNTGPTTTIGTPKPSNPNSGTSVTFKFTASESPASFVCSLAKGAEPDSFSSCVGTGLGKTYENLTDGSYSFKVHATDSLGNVGADAPFPFTVDTSLQDHDPPDTTITSQPTNPSSSTTAAFTYKSTEAGSSFECKLDAGAFTGCQTSGITYNGLGEGQHTFQVRAKDTSANVDLSPAGYSFSIVLPVIQPPIEVKPPEEPKPGPTAPETTITSKPKAKTADRTPTFKFKSSVAGAAYECKLDGKALKPCRSPLTTKMLSFGRHTLKVAAVAGGLKDATPAVTSFKVVKPK